MTAATGNLYVGLAEYEDMGFLLHCLRPDDLFVDIGANVGTYSVLASGVVGARTIAFEPIDRACDAFVENMRLNQIEGRVDLRRLALGRQPGHVRFTVDLDAVNHVATSDEPADQPVIEVPVGCLDTELAGRAPAVVKIDVEGFESEVVAGGREILRAPSVVAVIAEANNSGARYGKTDDVLIDMLRDMDFTMVSYDPTPRTLRPRTADGRAGNIVFVRDVEAVAQRLTDAPAFRVLGRAI